jgi:hypothetical protein
MIVLYEKVDIKKVDHLLSLAQIRDDPEKDIQARSLLTKYKKYYNHKYGHYTSYYRQSPLWKGYGRCYPHSDETKGIACGLALLSKDIRSFLGADHYVDLDLEKCHWYILRHLLCKYNFDFKLIDNLLDDYSSITDFIQSNFTCKPKGGVFAVLNSEHAFMSVQSKALVEEFPVLKQIHNLVYSSFLTIMKAEESELYKLVEKINKSPKNIQGTFIATLLQNIEKTMIFEILDMCKARRIEVGSIIHDGFLVHKKDQHQLEQLTEDVKQVFEDRYAGMKANLIVKSFPDHAYSLPEVPCPLAAPSSVIHLFTNDKYTFTNFKIQVQGMVFSSFEDLKKQVLLDLPRVLHVLDNPKGYLVKDVDEDGHFKVVPKDQKRLADCHMFYMLEGVEKSTSLLGFIHDPEIYRCFKPISHLCFEPNPSAAQEYSFNTFQGFKAPIINSSIEPLNAEEYKRLYDLWLFHLEKVYASDDPVLYHYFIVYFASIVQKPWEKTRVVPILYSPQQQVGKNIFIDFFRKHVIGWHHSAERSSLKQITDDKNGDLAHLLFIVVNEASTKEFHIDWNLLKDLITANRRRVRPLFIDAYEVTNYLNIILTTNNKNSVKIEGNYDARYVPVEVNPVYYKNEIYFDRLVAEGFTDEIGSLMYRFLMNVTIDINIKDLPHTKLKDDMIINSLSMYDQFKNDIKDHLVEEMRTDWSSTLDYSTIIHQDSKYITLDFLFKTFKEWCLYNNLPAKSRNQFKSKMGEQKRIRLGLEGTKQCRLYELSKL